MKGSLAIPSDQDGMKGSLAIPSDQVGMKVYTMLQLLLS